MKKVLQVIILLIAMDVLIDIAINATFDNFKNELNKITYEINTIETEIEYIEDKLDIPVHTRADEVEQYTYDTKEQIQEEVRLGEMEMLAQLVEAEAGNQDMYGKRLVADVVLNRVADKDFPNTIEEVIYQKIGNTYMFSSVGDGNFDRAGWIISQDSFKAAQMEYESSNCTDQADCGYHLLYFRTERYSDYGTPLFKHGAHYFSCGD